MDSLQIEELLLKVRRVILEVQAEVADARKVIEENVEKAGGCEKVTKTLLEVLYSCPIISNCNLCGQRKECSFPKRVGNLLEAKTRREAHIKVYENWMHMKTLLRILSHLEKVEQVLACLVEGGSSAQI